MEYSRWKGIRIEKRRIWFLASIKKDETMKEVKLNPKNHQSYEWQQRERGQTWIDKNRNWDMEECLKAAATEIDNHANTQDEQDERVDSTK
jgi:hypothetical protein